MRSQSEILKPESSPANTRPIELLTENGFSILRLWEINREPVPLAGRYTFIVRHPPNPEREITVEIADELVVEIELKTAGRVLTGSTFWICCAERHLATYLWESDDCPLGDSLCVSQLNPEDVMSAIRWGTS